MGYLERYDEYTEIIIDDLNNIAETLEDAAFEKMVQEIDLNAEDKGLSKVKQALAYICENYRIERKDNPQSPSTDFGKDGETNFTCYSVHSIVP